MPTYEYKCTKCGYIFEEFQSINDRPFNECPKCKGKTERVITGGTGFLLKGTGFYSTDHRSESYKKGEIKERDSFAPSPSTDGKKDDTKKKPKKDAK